MWSQIESFFAWIWANLRNFSKYIVSSLLVLAVIIAGIWVAVKNDGNKKTDSQSKNPEVAQLFEPSIGTPLPPDENKEAVSTSEQKVEESKPTEEVAKTETPGTVAGATTTTQPTTTFVAPKAGVSDNEPVPYQNDQYNFGITLPPYTKVVEQGNLIRFTNGSLLFYVNVISGNEDLNQIYSQLSNSTEVKNISWTMLSGNTALKFTIGGNTGYAVRKNNSTYYLIGQDKYISQIKL